MAGNPSRLEKYEGIREDMVDAIIARANGVKNLDLDTMEFLEKTINNGAKNEMGIQKLELEKKSEASESEMRQAATNYILAQRELGNRRAQEAREAGHAGQDSLPVVAERKLLPNEGAQGQFQVGFDVLSGQKPFNPAESQTKREALPEVP